MSDQRYSLDDLLHLMQRLRDPDTGCPWDIKQNYKTIAPSTIEEAYEVVDAIDKGDLPHLQEELGDLLFQIVFYCQLASEEAPKDSFNFSSVVNTLTEKLLRRHPHVFVDGDLYGQKNKSSLRDEAAVKAQWELIKSEERENKGEVGIFDDVPSGLPALKIAEKIQKRASMKGFDWSDAMAVIGKLKEEVSELEVAMRECKLNEEPFSAEVENELGDVMFTCVNLSRHVKKDAEGSLRGANTKFMARFGHVLALAEKKGLIFQDLSADAMEQLWQEVKSSEL